MNSLVIRWLTVLGELFHYSAELGHALLDATTLVMCDGKLYMAENECIIELSRRRIIFCRLDEFVHDKVDCIDKSGFAWYEVQCKTHFDHGGNRCQDP